MEAASDLVVLRNGPDEEALAKAVREPAIAVVIWDGVSHGDRDITEEFGAEARWRGLELTEVRTLRGARDFRRAIRCDSLGYPENILRGPRRRRRVSAAPISLRLR